MMMIRLLWVIVIMAVMLRLVWMMLIIDDEDNYDDKIGFDDSDHK